MPPKWPRMIPVCKNFVFCFSSPLSLSPVKHHIHGASPWEYHPLVLISAWLLLLSVSRDREPVHPPVFAVTYPTCQLRDYENEAKKRKFSHWNKVEIPQLLPQFIPHARNTCLQSDSNNCSRAQKYCPFSPLIHSFKKKKKLTARFSRKPYTWCSSSYLWEWKAISGRGGPNILPLNSKRRKKRSPWLDLQGEHDYLSSNADVNISTHSAAGSESCWVLNEPALYLLILLSYVLGGEFN